MKTFRANNDGLRKKGLWEPEFGKILPGGVKVSSSEPD